MIELIDVELHAGSFCLSSISLAIPTGTYAVLQGPNGAGKTTLLECLAGLRLPIKGQVRLLGEDCTFCEPHRRRIGYVPQDRALFPTMTVREHLEFSLRMRRRPAAEIRQRADELAERLGLTGLLQRRPAQLSGGQAQRVALGRALAASPPIVLLDEPLTAIDQETQVLLTAMLADLGNDPAVTVLHVTHRPEEAAALGNQFFHLDADGLSQVSHQANRSDVSTTTASSP